MKGQIAHGSEKGKTYAFEHGVQGQDRRQNFVGQDLRHF